MIKIVEPSWLEEHLSDPSLVAVDPRPVVKYLAGHIPKALNFPMSKLLDPKTLALNSPGQLGRVLGASGIDDRSTIVLYDGYDGQSAAMLGWTLEYLGHRQVAILSSRIEGWAEDGRELLYKPVAPQPKNFDVKLNNTIRALPEELLQKKDGKILDLRGRDEYGGIVATEVRTGHIPSARNVPWTDLIGDGHAFLRSRIDLEEVARKKGLTQTDNIVTYCSYGPRAAIGYLAFQTLGYEVKVYDGSFHQWAQNSRFPVEGEGLQISL